MGVGSVLSSGCEPADWQTQVPMFCLPWVCCVLPAALYLGPPVVLPSCLSQRPSRMRMLTFSCGKPQSHSNSQNLRIRTD
uniref:Uncharacterized protein n=1 Tax=Anguilla anguilla TaxID=7936 RepID=A0A0E9W0J1_ANGAN